MFFETANTPAEICAAVEPAKRKRKATRQQQTTSSAPSAPFASSAALGPLQPKKPELRAGNPITPAIVEIQPTTGTPEWASGKITAVPYAPTPEIAETCDAIVSLHRLRQGMIKAQTKLILQAKASIRFATQTDDDFASDEAKAAARKRNDGLYSQVAKDESHPLHANLAPYHAALVPLEVQRKAYEKEMVRLVKLLPVYDWVKSVKGFGDISFATIVGECGDVGSFSSFSALWKRMGVAVVDGKRQGAPGKDATAEDWTRHGYSPKRRSVGYVAREHLIGGMGKWRPVMDEDVYANPDLTHYQRVYAERARLESVKLGLPVTCSAKGKESYKKHVSMRAHRYVEKQLLKHLYIEWRRA